MKVKEVNEMGDSTKKQIDNSDKDSYPDFHFHIQTYMSPPPALLTHIRNVLMKRQNILEQLCSFFPNLYRYLREGIVQAM